VGSDVSILGRGKTPREFSRVHRLSVDRVLGMIRAGKLGALNLSVNRCGRPRFVIMPDHEAAFRERYQGGNSASTGPAAKSDGGSGLFPGFINGPRTGCSSP
jgi:hypothetical protein